MSEMMTGGEQVGWLEIEIIPDDPSDPKEVRLAQMASKLANALIPTLDFSTLPTARIISLEEAKTTKGSVYFTKEGPIVWD